MKKLHRRDLFSWAVYAEKLDIDFNGFAWTRGEGNGGNVLIDPVSMTPHDRAHLEELGGASWIVVTNSDHVRATVELAKDLGAKIAGPAAERETFPLRCDKWLAEGDEPFPGLRVIELLGSKTPGELALVLEESTLFCGDLVRSHRANALMMLLETQGLKDRAKAVESIARLARLEHIEAVLVGDGWCVFRDGRKYLEELTGALTRA
jgi:glyoxylase-like metal-dependent hydrolase (beta-lactamase superfamily II)